MRTRKGHRREPHRREPHARHRGLSGLVLATVLAIGIGASPAGVRTALAVGPLRTAAHATYTLDPADGRVHVAIEWRVTNLKPDTPTIVYFYSDVSFAIQPDARGLRASDANGALAITTRPHRFYTEAEVHLRRNLFYQESTTFTVRYDLVGGEPRSESPIRVGEAFATFGVWAWGDTGRGTVEVRTPKGFGSQVDGSAMQLDTDTSGQTLTASPGDPQSFFAIVSSENRSAYGSTRVSLDGEVEIVVRAWPEDRAWDDTVSETLRTAIPELLDLIGLPWPVEHDLNVRERYTPALEGYAGIFFTDEQRIDISEDLDPVIIVHEASHAWFDQDLFTDRWIYEGLAEEYAWQVLSAVGADPGDAAEEPDLDDPGYLALSGWSFPEVIRDQETDDLERYGYQAAYWVMDGIVRETGLEAMREAFLAADANRTAYPGAGTPEVVGRVDSWRRFLDLVEPIDQPDADAIDALLRDFVVRGNDARDLDERRAARDAYRGLVDAGDGWAPPWYVRLPMGEWRFDLATGRIAEAGTVLELRERVAGAAGALGLEPDDALRTAYEAATEGFEGPTGIGDGQLAALAALADARTTVDAQPDIVAQIGLIGETPRVPYEAAREAFERGELETAVASATAAVAIITGAAATGQQRLLIAVGVAVLVLVLLLVLGVVIRRRRRRGHALALAAAAAAPATAAPGSAWTPFDPAGTQPYATLAADPAPTPAPSGEGRPDVDGGHPRGDTPADP